MDLILFIGILCLTTRVDAVLPSYIPLLSPNAQQESIVILLFDRKLSYLILRYNRGMYYTLPCCCLCQPPTYVKVTGESKWLPKLHLAFFFISHLPFTTCILHLLGRISFFLSRIFCLILHFLSCISHLPFTTSHLASLLCCNLHFLSCISHCYVTSCIFYLVSCIFISNSP